MFSMPVKSVITLGQVQDMSAPLIRICMGVPLGLFACSYNALKVGGSKEYRES